MTRDAVRVGSADKEEKLVSPSPKPVPLGLRPLADLSRFFVRQQLVCCAGCTENRFYLVSDESGAPIFGVEKEDSHFCGFLHACRAGSFVTRVRDGEGNDVASFGHSGCFGPWSLDISTGHGIPLGRVEADGNLLPPFRVSVSDAEGNARFRLEGPGPCPGCEAWNVELWGESLPEGPVVVFRREWGAEARVEVTFPPGLQVETKVLLLGALFLMNSLYSGEFLAGTW